MMMEDIPDWLAYAVMVTALSLFGGAGYTVLHFVIKYW